MNGQVIFTKSDGTTVIEMWVEGAVGASVKWINGEVEGGRNCKDLTVKEQRLREGKCRISINI